MSIESLIQIAGSLLILVPFVLVQLRRMRTDTTAYAALNLVGSAVLAVDALHGHQWGFLLLEGTWAVVSAYALVRRTPARPTSSDLGRTRRATLVGQDRVMDRLQIELPAGTIHYRESGPADGRPVVFVHGFLVDDTLWSDVPERLAKAGFHTFAPTWPLASHTTAMKPGADLSPRGVARVVASFLEALDLHDVTIVGSDTGERCRSCCSTRTEVGWVGWC